MVEINNLTKNKIDKSFLKEIAKLILKKEGREDFNLSIALVGPSEIQKLNKKYRGKDSVTDVLSFLNKNDIIKNKGVDRFDGEIILCPKRIEKDAQELDKKFKEELDWALIHGVLHLLGYNHKKEDDSQKMREKEKYYLNF